MVTAKMSFVSLPLVVVFQPLKRRVFGTRAERETKKGSKTSAREFERRGTHISIESLRCQLCLLSILVADLLSDVFVLLELCARCMKLMLYHFLDFSKEFSCGFNDDFLGLFSACGCGTEPSRFVSLASHFSIKFLPSHSSLGSVEALSVSSPAEFSSTTSDCVTSSPIFMNYTFQLSDIFIIFGLLDSFVVHKLRENSYSSTNISLLISRDIDRILNRSVYFLPFHVKTSSCCKAIK